MAVADPTEGDLPTKSPSSVDFQEIHADVLQELGLVGEHVKKLMARFIDLEEGLGGYDSSHPGLAQQLDIMKTNVPDIREELSSAHRRFGHIGKRIDSFLVQLNSRSMTTGPSARITEDISSEVSRQPEVDQQKAPVPVKSEPHGQKITVSQAGLSALTSASGHPMDANATKTQAAQPQASSSSIRNEKPQPPTEGLNEVKVSDAGEDWLTLFKEEAKLSERGRGKTWNSQVLGTVSIQEKKGGGIGFRVLIQRKDDGKEKAFAQHIRHSMTSKMYAPFSVLWSGAEPKKAKYAAAFETSELAVQFNQVFSKALKQSGADNTAGVGTGLPSSLSAPVKLHKPIAIPCIGVTPPSAEAFPQLAGQPSSSSSNPGFGGQPFSLPVGGSDEIGVLEILEGAGRKATGGGDEKRANPVPVAPANSILQEVGLISSNPKKVSRPAKAQASQSVVPVRPTVKSARSASVYNLRSVPQPALEATAQKPEKKQLVCDRDGCLRKDKPYVLEKAYLNHMEKHLVKEQKQGAGAAPRTAVTE